MEREHKVTRTALAAALEQWEKAAKEEGWPDRSDDGRHLDNADYLLDLIENPA